MLAYRRRGTSNSNTPIVRSNSDTTFLGYCNWSYSKNHHITVHEAISMLKSYNTIYMPYYIRIFNEMPRKVLSRFINNHSISYESILGIHTQLIQKSTFRIKSI